jgi:hypothetical protein
MEINFSEINNTNTQNLYEQYNDNEIEINNSDKYWETANTKKEQQSKKKKVSFTDILSNMNLVVNKNGVLQQIKPLQLQNEEDYQYSQQNPQQNTVDPRAKNSYIYNKYFKDYTSANTPPPEKKIPKTIEEYNQMVYAERIQQIQQRKRATEIKSTKLMFTTNPGNYANNSVNPRNIQASRNSLCKMAFG